MSAPERLGLSHEPVQDRGADASAPRPTPLTLVAGAVAGETPERVAANVAEAVRCPVAIAIPAHGAPVVSPPGSLSEDATAAIAGHAAAVAAGEGHAPPPPIVEAVPVRIGEQVVGIVAATGGAPSPERRAWLEAAAAAASVTALIRDAPGPDSADNLVIELARGAPEDVPGLLARARRLGLDLSAGAVALSVQGGQAGGARPTTDGTLSGTLRSGRVAVVVPVAGEEAGLDQPADLAGRLRAGGAIVAVSTPRRDPALVHEAIREAELLSELGGVPGPQHGGHDETYRLLIGVLLRDRAELEQLRDRTVTPLAQYDDRHDTELLATLRAFLAHDGSTTETAEALALHRHTVGYRLSRVQEVSGLSPYESDGRERLGLGIKAQQILEAERRLASSPD